MRVSAPRWTVRWLAVRTLAWAGLLLPLIAASALGRPRDELPSKTKPPAAKAEKMPAAGKDKAAGKEKASEPPPILQQMDSALENLVARVSPAVVQILVTGYGTAGDGGHTNTALIVRQHAVGSGVIVDSSGYIITNAHVVEGAQRIRVTLPVSSDALIPEGKRQIVDARLVGIHKETDLALLKIDETDLPTLSLAAPRSAHEGQLVVAIGSPEGLQNSVTLGVVSAVARQADPQKPMLYIQTDAPINPGNSGGPLVDMEGSVLGINTFILSASGGSEGLGFAIPSGVVRFVYRSLRKYGHVHRIEVGAGTQAITPPLAEGLGLRQSWGVIVDDVVPGGPADSAGLKIQDILLTADGRRIETLPALSAALYLHPLDEALKLEVLRGSEKKTLLIPAVEHRDPMDQLADATDPEKSLIPRLGILAIDLTDQLRSMVGNLRIQSGVVVVGRAADLILPDTGVQAGDVLHSLNKSPIDSLESLRTAVKALKPGDAVVLQVERDGGLLYLSFEME
jgi:serine protease Do